MYTKPKYRIYELLLKQFEILEVNEYNTSKLYNKTLKEFKNVPVIKNKHKKHLHENTNSKR